MLSPGRGPTDVAKLRSFNKLDLQRLEPKLLEPKWKHVLGGIVQLSDSLGDYNMIIPVPAKSKHKPSRAQTVPRAELTAGLQRVRFGKNVRSTLIANTLCVLMDPIPRVAL